MPRFVLLHHRGHPEKPDHYDLMIEREGVLRTWVMKTGDLEGEAVQSSDHRLLYADHEGEVSGGRGEVRRVARGNYEVESWESDAISLRFPDFLLTLKAQNPPCEGALWDVQKGANLT